MSRSDTLPLIDRSLDGVMAVGNGPGVRVRRFLGDVDALAARLPEGGHVLNLARDRYRFTVAFAAVMVRGQCNLLPPNAGKGTQRAIVDRHGDACVLHDGVEVAKGLRALDLRERVRVDPGVESGHVPRIDANALVSISYTSGSTGAATPIHRLWRTHHAGAALNTTAYLPGADQALGMVATVPAQHMYGLEVTVMIPLRGEVAVHGGMPMYPADVARALAEAPTPRVLVSTPLHLKALVESRVDFPAVSRILSATAPLDTALARDVERLFGCELLDVYGCSETGCLAVRRPATDGRWMPIEGFGFRVGADQTTLAVADHLPGPVALQDRLRVDSGGHLVFEGRASDLVNVGGKRGSLAELTALLNRVPGVLDGVVFLPEGGTGTGRLAALYTGDVEPADIRRHLREHVDAVLVPRPMLKVDALPRNETGKLPRAALQDLLDRHAKR